MEGLLSTMPTPSSLFTVIFIPISKSGISKIFREKEVLAGEVCRERECYSYGCKDGFKGQKDPSAWSAEKAVSSQDILS